MVVVFQLVPNRQDVDGALGFNCIQHHVARPAELHHPFTQKRAWARLAEGEGRAGEVVFDLGGLDVDGPVENSIRGYDLAGRNRTVFVD